MPTLPLFQSFVRMTQNSGEHCIYGYTCIIKDINQNQTHEEPQPGGLQTGTVQALCGCSVCRPSSTLMGSPTQRANRLWGPESLRVFRHLDVTDGLLSEPTHQRLGWCHMAPGSTPLTTWLVFPTTVPLGVTSLA